ncbi:aminoglycoside phosphotransferase family protein [Paenibacillus sp. chi10]|uniref:Aminoglycoside phosphotransferase family protein n=1 Tax=Paenibacillus suaedae TaxID=3077233 RepID=A0AAJ2K036_9BACL|nr:MULTISPECIES: aminoglycoside phosphotransferase family protein [unclassified Paenibacillus]MDT8977679.1 aminoglycoside phosphotransferase family protein [Paenibacillus sp. chi10]GAV13033.1 aminoglycoside/hydroxyurea antibiotic resistance kinase [Paenibacillus sp. NAIST15-1]
MEYQSSIFTQEQIETIVKRFGNTFYEQMLRHLDDYAEKWSLSSLQLIPSFSANIVFTCYSDQVGHAVLKIGEPSETIWTEVSTMRLYNGQRFCKVYEADIENGVILLELLQPGTPLRDEQSLQRRLDIFCSLYSNLHIAAVEAEKFPTYIGWVERITDYMNQRNDCPELSRHMQRARDICLSIASSYSQNLLLHGDLHHDNMLLSSDGEYVIIDPKGVIGDPIFDIPRFILNEFDNEITSACYEKIDGIMITLARRLSIPHPMIRKCLYVETAMGMCWCVEDGSTPEEYTALVQKVAFAEAIMNEQGTW